jgi:hypothetical protein
MIDPVDLAPVEVVTLPPGAWCVSPSPADDRAGDRLELTRRKNAAFAAWDRAALLCERRRHSTGCVPPAWTARLALLEAEYRRAVKALAEVVRQWDW